MNIAEVRLKPSAVRDERPVLATATLRPGFNRADLSRYDDPSWDLSPAVFRENVRRCETTVHFDAIDVAMAAALREYLYARLNFDMPGYRIRLPPASVRQVFNRVRRFLSFVVADLGRVDFGAIDQALIERYARSLKASGISPIVVAQLLEIVFDLHAWREHLPTAHLRFEPWPSRSPSSVAGYRFERAENRTPRIPEAIIAPLITWSFRYIEVFAPDILAARMEQTDLERHRDALSAADAGLSGRERRRRWRERLAVFIEQRRAEGRGIPIWTTSHNGRLRHDSRIGENTPPVNSHLLHLFLGMDPIAHPGEHLYLSKRAAAIIEAAVGELGTEVGGMDTPISLLPGRNIPWRSRFDIKTLAHEERMLQAACYVVCAYLTGMRDSEVQAMRMGCMSLTRSEDGLITRHRIRSVEYKGRSATGEAAEWVTIAPVAQAIKVLEQLSARAAAVRNVDTLWPELSLKSGTKTHVSAEIVRQINVYRDHLNTLFGTEAEPVIPLGPSGAPWRLTTRQFRRTIAWHIANRPFGTIAGMIQYKHASVAAFEGYAGSSRSGFRAEIDAERRLGQLDDLLVYFDERHAGNAPSGPAGPRIVGALDAAAELGPSPVMIADRGRVRALLASLARTLHVGVLADCFFDPSTALCLQHSTAVERQTPLITLCQPTRCPNSCITERHRPAWTRAAADAESMLREKRLTEPQRVAIRQDLERFRAILDAIGR